MSKAVVEHLNLELATAFVQSFNAQRYHWMVSGPHFRDYHLRFGELYEAVHATIDELAERVRMLDGTPITSPSQMESLSVVKPSDTKKRLDAPGMLKEALAGQDKIIALMHKGIEIADQAGDPGTSDLLTRFVQDHQKEAWFLREMLA